MIGNPPFTPRVKKVLALAIKEATAMAHQHVGTEHIVLGLLREGDGVAAHVLKALNVDIEKTRAEVLKLYQAGSAAADGSKPDETAAPARASEADFSGNLTPRAQRALVLARDEADALNLSYVGTEHVLMGLIRLGRGVAVNVLAKIELNSETVGARLEALAGRRPVEKSGERPYYALLVKEALSFASEEARNLDHTYIGTEHILLGLLRQREGGAASIFKNLNIDTEAVRREILTELIPNFSSTPEIPMQPNPSSPRREPVDLNLRYDVYCAERNLKVVVYRDVQFKAVKTLFPRHERDLLSDFVELEQRDGQIVFVAKSTVIRFCQHGMNPQGKIETGES
jgi:ATP-dependent Clp protease ATP-binding subunit ClpA